MGLFDFLKQLAGTAIEVGTTAPKNTPVYETDTHLIPGAPAVDLYSFRGTPKEYFSRILSGCFSDYEVRQNIEPAAITTVSSVAWTCRCGVRNYSKFCTECGKPQPELYYPITFLMYRNSTPVLAILLCDKNRANVRRTIQACQSIGLPCQCYYTHFRNKASYVTDRIRTDLR